MTLTLLTPTYRGDLDRFALQRESIERCGIALPHIAVVHTEDLPLFRTIEHQRNLTILTTRDVLGKQVDRRRRAWMVRRLNPLHWTVRKPIAGWMSQQLVKLAACDFIETDGIVCLDSDTFFIRRASAEDFYTAKKLHLYETSRNIDVEMAGWLAASMTFLGIPSRGLPLRQYTHHPFCMHREVLLGLHKYVSEKHRKNWIDAVLESNVFECMTYGAYARHIHRLEMLDPVEPAMTLSYWWPEQVQSLADDFLHRITEPHIKAVLIQSNAGELHAYRELISQAWNRLNTRPSVGAFA